MRERILGMFLVVANKEALVADYVWGMGSDVFWDVGLRRNLQHWEMDQLYFVGIRELEKVNILCGGLLQCKGGLM